MADNLMSGVAQKTAGDTVRLACDFGDLPELIAGASITAKTVTATPTGLTISGVQLDYTYQVSARFSGGTAGTSYNVVFTITLDDSDSTVIRRTGTLKVL